MVTGVEMLGAHKKPNNMLAVWGNSSTMNLNPLILTNIETSPYFIGRLSQLKTYHELVDEIYYKVSHLEPWEKGSRAIDGRRQTGMCGGVRGVGVGGIISSAFCILYKLFTMRLTRKQVFGLINHADSPFIRGIGFLYVRFMVPPAEFWEWFEEYIEDEEEIDVRAGGGQTMTIGQMVRLFLTRLNWFSSPFPRIPVPIQIAIDKKLAALKHFTSTEPTAKKPLVEQEEERERGTRTNYGKGEERSRKRSRSRSPRRRSRSRDKYRRSGRSRSRESYRHKEKNRRSKSPKRSRRSRSRSKSRYEKSSRWTSRYRNDNR